MVSSRRDCLRLASKRSTAASTCSAKRMRLSPPRKPSATAFSTSARRCAHPVDAVAEAHHPLAVVQRLVEPGIDVGRGADGVQHVSSTPVPWRADMQRHP